MKEGEHLQVENLISREVSVFGNIVSFNIHDCVDGRYNCPNPVEELALQIQEALIKFPKMKEFIFIGQSKTFSYFVTSSRPTFMIFNSHNVDVNNRYPLNRRGQGFARVFACSSAQALARTILADAILASAEGAANTWAIYAIEIITNLGMKFEKLV